MSRVKHSVLRVHVYACASGFAALLAVELSPVLPQHPEACSYSSITSPMNNAYHNCISICNYYNSPMHVHPHMHMYKQVCADNTYTAI